LFKPVIMGLYYLLANLIFYMHVDTMYVAAVASGIIYITVPLVS
jgi:hypothetical protein